MWTIFWTFVALGALGQFMWDKRKAKKAQLKQLQEELAKYKKYYNYQ